MKILHYGIVLLFMVTLWGCSEGNSSAPVTIDPATNKHPAGWAINGTGGAHPYAYFTAPTSCQSCHGLPSDPKGGISGVSCSNPGRSGVACHPAFPHAIGFAQFSRHGSVAKDTASGVTGMAHCKQCHGSNYTGAGLAPSCIKCHNDYNASNVAPHAANWSGGKNLNGLNHSTTVENNASACAQCHSGGNLSPIAPPSPAPPAGTVPGCFNGTLCHYDAGHTFKYAGHFIPARSNLASCQPCHAIPASGPNPSYTVPKNAFLSPNGCEKCHYKVSGTPSGLAHPYMWVPGRGNPGQQSASHANAGTVNASCGLCHGGFALAGGGSGPSCFRFPASSINGTVCHFTKPVDAQGVSVGCISCHATPPNSTSPPTAGSPNLDYGHKAHWAIPGIAANGGCNTCHQGKGYGTATHADGTVQTSPLATKFQNTSGTIASYNTGTGGAGSGTGTCSNVSCHGNFLFSAQEWKNTTPVLPVLQPGDDKVSYNSYCYYCHKVSTAEAAKIVGVPFPYIGPFSGRVPKAPLNDGNNLHQAHLVKYNVYCMDCHTLNVHFNSLMQGRRILVSGFAAPSVGGTGTSVITYTAGNGSPGTGSCFNITGFSVISNSAACHPNEIRTWY